MENETEQLQEEREIPKLINRSVVTAEIAYSVQEKALKRGKWFLFFLFLIIFAAAVVTNIPAPPQSETWEGWVFVGLMTVFLIVIECLILFGYEKAVKKNLQVVYAHPSEREYTFSPLYFEVNGKSGEGVEEYVKIAYHRLLKVEETPTAWRLYLNASVEYLVLKSGMEAGTQEELSRFLSPRVAQYLAK